MCAFTRAHTSRSRCRNSQNIYLNAFSQRALIDTIVCMINQHSGLASCRIKKATGVHMCAASIDVADASNATEAIMHRSAMRQASQQRPSDSVSPRDMASHRHRPYCPPATGLATPCWRACWLPWWLAVGRHHLTNHTTHTKRVRCGSEARIAFRRTRRRCRHSVGRGRGHGGPAATSLRRLGQNLTDIAQS